MKYQWLKIDWEIEFKELKSSLLSLSYTESSGKGFVLDQDFNSRKLSGRFINKSVIDRETTPPYGRAEKFQEIIYTTYQFVIDMETQPSLLIINPPRAGTPFTTALAIASNHRITVHQTTIDLIGVIRDLQESLSHFSLLSLDVKKIPFSKGSSANLILRGKGDLLDELKDLPKYKKGHISKIEFSFMSEFGTHKAVLSDKARFEINDQRIEHILFPVVYEIVSKHI